MERSNTEILKKNIEDWFYHLTGTGIAPNEAAARAIQLVKSGKLYSEVNTTADTTNNNRTRYDSTSTRLIGFSTSLALDKWVFDLSLVLHQEREVKPSVKVTRLTIACPH